MLRHANPEETTYARIAPQGAGNRLGDVWGGLGLPVRYRPVWGGADMSGSARWIVIGYRWPGTSENTLSCCLADMYLRI